MKLKKVLELSLKKEREQITQIKKNIGNKKIGGNITVNHLFKGMRGLPQAYTATSHVDPQQGVLYRGKTLHEVHKLLPKVPNAEYPSIETVFWFLLTGEIPTKKDVTEFIKELHMHANVPHHVYNVMESFPKHTRPMTRFCSSILALTTTSSFQDYYDRGTLSKEDYWKFAFDDAIKLIANLSQVTAYIYRVYCTHKDPIASDPNEDWAGNFSQMLGFDDTNSKNLFRMFLFTHADHSASNVSAHTAHTVGSALSNVYYTLASSMLGLAGPLHGHANAETVVWLLRLLEKSKKEGNEVPSDEFIHDYIQATLDAGKVIPGYGHAALRVEDPRFTMFYKRCEKEGFNTVLLQMVDKIYKMLPAKLAKVEKISNPNPNIDAISGSCLYSKGIVEHEFYTVLFGMSRLFGILAQHILDRGIGQPIFRPKTISLYTLQEMEQETKKKK